MKQHQIINYGINYQQKLQKLQVLMTNWNSAWFCRKLHSHCSNNKIHSLPRPTVLINTFFVRDGFRNGNVFVLVSSNFVPEIVFHRKRDAISMVDLEKAEVNIHAISGHILESNLSIMRLDLVLGKVNTRCATCKNNTFICRQDRKQTKFIVYRTNYV